MKRYLKAFLGLSLLSLLSYMTACKRTQPLKCESCCDVEGQRMTFTNAETGKVYTFQFYNAFTPLNEQYCEYEESVTGTPVKIESSCRPNPDSLFNDDLNRVFTITGYSPSEMFADGYRTYLRIMAGDTTPVWESLQRPRTADASERANLEYGADGYFDGSDYENVYGYGEQKVFFASGRYEYKFFVYDTLVTQGEYEDPFEGMTDDDILLTQLVDPALYAQLLATKNANIAEAPIVKEEFIVDTVVGMFCIIRNDVDCDVSGCVGADQGDPLLH